MCKICEYINADDKIKLYSEQDNSSFINRVWNGEITIYNLSVKRYKTQAKKFEQAVYKGYGKSIIDVDFDTPDYEMLFDLRENVYIFTAAKEYQLVKKLNEQLIRGDDKVASFSEFKKEAIKIVGEFDVNHLNVEYNNAIAQAQSAANWQSFEEVYKANSDLSLLKYVTAHDSRVRPEHADLEGIARPIGDPFWDEYYPPNGWRCRCRAIQVSESEYKPTNLHNFAPPKDVPVEFRFNSGKQKIIFSPKHSYFKIVDKDKNLALNNFNLPLPKN